MLVYHGSTIEITKPDIDHAYRNLDFGKGFYVTTVFEQAERWAKRKADILQLDKGIISEFTMSEDTSHFLVNDFGDNLESWIDFVCSCRDGSEDYLIYDIIKGKVANDKVFRVVDLYKNGIWDKERAIEEMHIYENYDQIAFISQRAIDELLIFNNSHIIDLH